MYNLLNEIHKILIPLKLTTIPYNKMQLSIIKHKQYLKTQTYLITGQPS